MAEFVGRGKNCFQTSISKDRKAMSIISSSPLESSSSPSASTASPPSVSPSLHQLEQIRLHQLYTIALADRMRFLSQQQQTTTTNSHLHSSPLLPYVPGPKTPSSSIPSSPASASHHHPGSPPVNADDPKPQQSYIGLISMAILSSKEHKLVLADIYQYILDNYAYFRHRGPGWRNSIRHNLSLNDCFIKAGRAANGKGHYWAIHPACKDDFQRGDYRRRKAQRKVRRHMGLAVEEEDSPSPPPPPQAPPPTSNVPSLTSSSPPGPTAFFPHWGIFPTGPHPAPPTMPPTISPFLSSTSSSPEPGSIVTPRKRQFDVASLLRPKSPEDLLEEATPNKIPPPFLPWLVDQSHQEYFAKYYQSLLGASPAPEEDIVAEEEEDEEEEDEKSPLEAHQESD